MLQIVRILFNKQKITVLSYNVLYFLFLSTKLVNSIFNQIFIGYFQIIVIINNIICCHKKYIFLICKYIKTLNCYHCFVIILFILILNEKFNISYLIISILDINLLTIKHII